MKKAIIVFLLCALIFILTINLVFSEELDCEESLQRGKMDAKAYHKSGVWFLIGVPSGLILGPVGLVAVTGIGFISSPPLKSPLDEETNIDCYVKGYKKAAEVKNGLAALGGGLLGAAVFGIITAAWVGAFQ